MKKIIQKRIFRTIFEGSDEHLVRFSDLPKDIQDNDIIYIQRHEDEDNGNDYYPAYTELIVNREMEETDKEYQKRIKQDESLEKYHKQKRYETYLRLKEEFENT